MYNSGCLSLLIVAYLAWYIANAMQTLPRTKDSCSTNLFSIPNISGLELISISATSMRNYTYTPDERLGSPQESVAILSFCNVTVTYTHPGWDDIINVITYLPIDNWNGRFQANGGGGYVTGGEELRDFTMIPGLLTGYAVSTTDGGHNLSLSDGNGYASEWAHSSPGNVNWPLFVDFAFIAVHDMAKIGKVVINTFYGVPPKYSYFFGASTGGRQGHMLAQRYPEDFNGILAIHPAFNWSRFLFSNIWPVFLMDLMKVYPRPCEFEAFQSAALSACDGLDGITDGIVSRLDLCKFDAYSLVGKAFTCDGAEAVFSTEAAQVVAGVWDGPRSKNGKFQWYGFGIETNFSQIGIGSAVTRCNASNDCTAVPFGIANVWVRYWVAKNQDLDMSTITHEQWDELYHASVNEYDSIIGTNDPDLAAFRKAGGKMINWHGTADQAIPVNGSVDYYERVLKLDPMAQDFYRFYLAPGASHCLHCGVVPTKVDLMKAIRQWVEDDVAPEELRGIGLDRYGNVLERNLCTYPRVQHYIGGDHAQAEAFTCV